MTHKLEKETHNGITYLDTPGLVDVKIRQEAAKEITTALHQGGIYQVLFVFTLEFGRFRPEDFATMKLVLESAPDIKHFSVIINKLSANAYDRLLCKSGAKLKMLITELVVPTSSSDEPPTVLLLKNQIKLYDRDNEFVRMNELNEFVEKAPIINIKSAHVNNLICGPYFSKKKLDVVNRQLEELTVEGLRDLRKEQDLLLNQK